MKSYQITVAVLFVSFVVAMYSIFTGHAVMLQRAVGTMLLEAIVLMYCLYKNKQMEDRAYANKYRTTTTVTTVVNEEDVPPHIVAAMKAGMGWDTEAFEASLQVEEIIVPDFVISKLKNSMDLGTDLLCRKLDSVLDELDNFPAAPKQECLN